MQLECDTSVVALLAQALLSKWMSSKLQMEDEGDLTSSFERKSTAALVRAHPAPTSYGNFDGNARLTSVRTMYLHCHKLQKIMPNI